MFVPERDRTTDKLDFTSLNGFFLSLTEQDRDPLAPGTLPGPAFTDDRKADQPELSRSNVINSPFANFLARKLTGS